MKTGYINVPLDEEDIGPPQQTGSRAWLKLLTILSLVLNVTLIFLAFISSLRTPNPAASCIRQTSSYSPVLKDTNLGLVHQTVNGTLFPNSNPPSIWRSPPSPAVDKAWEDIANTDIFAISRADILSLGRDPEVITKVPSSYGFGEDIYFAELDGQHHLHCLMMIRRYAYLPQYFPEYESMNKMPVFHKNHLNHCVDILRQHLLCTFSTDIITYRWTQNQPLPQPDFSIEKVCRNRDDIQGWLDKRWTELPLTVDQRVNVPRPDNLAEIELPSNHYWDDLVHKAHDQGVEVHEYVD